MNISRRNVALIGMYLEGRTLKETGYPFGLSGEGVRKILRLEGVSTARRKRIYTNPFVKKPTLTLQEAFWADVDVCDEDQCWIWMGSRWNKYGRFTYGRRNFYTHRLAFMIFHRVSLRHWALHRCNTPLCCNPLHIYDGTPSENALDREETARTEALFLKSAG